MFWGLAANLRESVWVRFDVDVLSRELARIYAKWVGCEFMIKYGLVLRR